MGTFPCPSITVECPAPEGRVDQELPIKPFRGFQIGFAS
jgi:hypothetical protein